MLQHIISSIQINHCNPIGLCIFLTVKNMIKNWFNLKEKYRYDNNRWRNSKFEKKDKQNKKNKRK